MAPLQRSKSASQADNLQIQHFIHQHLLHKLYISSEFNCDGCNTPGFGLRYRCSPCDFDLHEQCATASHRISSHLHPHHHLILLNRPGDDHSHVCHACKGVTNGLSYTCEIQTCEFDVHTLCIQIPVVISSEPAVVASQHQYQKQQQVQGIHTMQLGGGYSQPVTVNYQQKQGMATTEVGGYPGVNNNQTHMINRQLPQQVGMPMAGFGGYHGAGNSQPVILNQQQQQQQNQGAITTAFGGYHGVNSNQTQMTNYHNTQQQGMPSPGGVGGYHGGKNSQPVMVNHQQPQQAVPPMAFSTNQQVMTNQHQQYYQQQQQAAATMGVGGYHVVNNNQTVMISHPPPPPPPQQPMSDDYTKVGKLAANIISTSLIGIPIFNPRN